MDTKLDGVVSYPLYEKRGRESESESESESEPEVESKSGDMMECRPLKKARSYRSDMKQELLGSIRSMIEILQVHEQLILDGFEGNIHSRFDALYRSMSNRMCDIMASYIATFK